MTIRIQTTDRDLFDKAQRDLMRLDWDNADLLAFDNDTGDVTLASPPDDAFSPAYFLYMLASSDVNFVIVPLNAEDLVDDTWNQLQSSGGIGLIPVCGRGVAFTPEFDSLGAVARVTVAYDASIASDGSYTGYQQQWTPTPVPTPHLLIFGLECASEAVDNAPLNPVPPWNVNPSNVPLSLENLLRKNAGLPPRAHVNNVFLPTCSIKPGEHDAAASPSPTPTSQKGDGWVHKIDCFVATAAYGSPIAPEVDTLRRFRDQVARATRHGSAWFTRFYRRYYEISPAIADRMRADPELCELLRIGIVEPYVRYLELAMAFPDAPLEGVPEPWRTLLADTRRNLDEWCERLGLPGETAGLKPEEAVREIGFAVRYALRDPARRAAFLERQRRDELLPIKLDPAAARKARAALAESGLAADAIDAIVPDPES